MKVIKRIAVFALITVIAFAFTACGSDSSDSGSSSSTKKPKVSYQTIYSEYSSKIKKAGTNAVKEYQKKAAGKSDINDLATIANDQVQTIADVQVEGGEKLAAHMASKGDEYEVYDKWFKKLYEVYNHQGMRVYKVYIGQYLDTIPGISDELKKQTMDQLSEQMEESMKQMAPEKAE
ncbi:hypothetical protein [Eubacterium sp. F2]|jgi:hypothetical protein|uniref:hypothetical protein n=1 Tax=Eubacterium sp. F2 TaxID=3381348 RepID=UPI003907F102|nr:hypothetical protein [Eubacterium sp.]MCH4078865.1 hypothetical protein [Eubacterium sp.]